MHGTGALAATVVLPGNNGPASGLLARGAGALAAVRSFPDERASYYSYEDDESRSLVGMLVIK